MKLPLQIFRKKSQYTFIIYATYLVKKQKIIQF